MKGLAMGWLSDVIDTVGNIPSAVSGFANDFVDGFSAGYNSDSNYSYGNNYTNAGGNESDTNSTITHDPDLGYGFTMGTNEVNREDDMPLIDVEWAKSRFMTPSSLLTPEDAANRFHTQASYKFVGTRLGEHIIMNPKPQFTRYADIKPLRRIHNTEVTIEPSTASLGLGRYYSESIDDYKQVVFLEFGVPEFNSLFTFFLRSIDYEDAYIARHGCVPYWYEIADTAGSMLRWVMLPGLSALFLVGKTLTSVFNIIKQNTFAYYYMKPTMHTYWGVASSILNMMATELGILNPLIQKDIPKPGEEKSEEEKAGEIGIKIGIDNADIGVLKYMLPGIVNTATNQIDLFAVATKAQRLAYALADEEAEAIRKVAYDNSSEYEIGSGRLDDENEYNKSIEHYDMRMNKLLASIRSSGLAIDPDDPGSGGGGTDHLLVDNMPLVSYVSFANKVLKEGGYSERAQEENTGSASSGATENKEAMKASIASETGNPNEPSEANTFKRTKDYIYNVKDTLTETEQNGFTRFGKSIIASWVDGGRWVPFHVDYVGEGSESFSSSTSEIETEGVIKQIGAAANTMRYNFAGGNLASFVGDAVDAATQVATGVLNGVTFGISGVIAGLLGGGFIDLPKKWDDTTFNLNNVTYKMQLRSPYGNVWSQLQDIYIPLALLIAGAAPLAAGKASYTSPFLCSAFCRGVQNVRLGMITDLSITRGTGNLGFDRDWRPLGIDVSFTVTDFSSIVTAPISRSYFGGLFTELEDDTPFGQYIAMLCGRDLATNAFYWNKFKMKLSRAVMNFTKGLTPEGLGTFVGDIQPFKGIAGIFMRNGSTMGNLRNGEPR